MRYGFFDAARMNVYVGCLADGNGAKGIPGLVTLGAEYHTEGDSNSSTFLGCYTEGRLTDAGTCEFYGQVNCIGGTLGNSTIRQHSSAFLLEHGVASRAPLVYMNYQGTKTYRISFGDGTQTVQPPSKDMVALNWATLDACGGTEDSTWLRYLDGDEAGHRWWGLINNEPTYRHMVRFPTTRAFARLAAPWFPNGIFLGRDDDMLTPENFPDRPPKVAFTAAAAPPKNQYDNGNPPITYERGDVVWNSRPELGGPLGQVCITSGTCAPAPLSGVQTAETVTVNPDVTTVKINILERLVQGQHITIGGTTNYRVVKITLPTIDISPNALPGAAPGTFLSAKTPIAIVGEPPDGIETAACVKVGDPTVTLNDLPVKGLVPGQKIEVANSDPTKPPNIHEIVKVTLPTIDIKTPPAPPGPPAGTIIANGTAIAFRDAEFATFGSVRGTVTVDVTATTALDATYETIKLSGSLAADTTITVPSEDGWSARFLDLTTRNGHALKVNAATSPGMADHGLTNGQTQRLYIEYDASVPAYNIRPEGPPA